MRTRLLIGAVGVAGASYGAWLLLGAGPADLVDIAVWLAAGVVLHDFVVVPLTLLACWVAGRALPSRLLAPVAVGFVVLGSLTLLAIPVLGGWGANPDNATILDRNYVVGWLVVAVLTVVTVLAAVVARTRRR